MQYYIVNKSNEVEEISLSEIERRAYSGDINDNTPLFTSENQQWTIYGTWRGNILQQPLNSCSPSNKSSNLIDKNENGADMTSSGRG